MGTKIATHCRPAHFFEEVGSDRDLMVELVDIYVRESACKFDELSSAVQAGDQAGMARLCHALRGYVGPFDAPTLMGMLHDIEQESKVGTCVCDAPRLAVLSAQIDAVSAELSEFIAGI